MWLLGFDPGLHGHNIAFSPLNYSDKVVINRTYTTHMYLKHLKGLWKIGYRIQIILKSIINDWCLFLLRLEDKKLPSI